MFNLNQPQPTGVFALVDVWIISSRYLIEVNIVSIVFGFENIELS